VKFLKINRLGQKVIEPSISCSSPILLADMTRHGQERYTSRQQLHDAPPSLEAIDDRQSQIHANDLRLPEEGDTECFGGRANDTILVAPASYDHPQRSRCIFVIVHYQTAQWILVPMDRAMHRQNARIFRRNFDL
jgi:hypothetical protein